MGWLPLGGVVKTWTEKNKTTIAVLCTFHCARLVSHARRSTVDTGESTSTSMIVTHNTTRGVSRWQGREGGGGQRGHTFSALPHTAAPKKKKALQLTARRRTVITVLATTERAQESRVGLDWPRIPPPYTPLSEHQAHSHTTNPKHNYNNSPPLTVKGTHASDKTRANKTHCCW